MGKGVVVSVQSFRGGTGKSNIAANMAVLAANAGRNVAILDTDLQSPGVHLIFNLRQDQIQSTFVDYLWEKCSILDAAYDMSKRVCDGRNGGKCWIIPGSLTAHAITQIINEGYDPNHLNAHFDSLIQKLDLDYLLIDTHPGLNRETLITTALSDVLILLLRPDQQDYRGTAVFLEVARKLDIPHIFLLMNKLYSHIDAERLSERVERSFKCPTLAMLPLCEEFARLESRDLFCRKHPGHEISHSLNAAMRRLFSLQEVQTPAPH